MKLMELIYLVSLFFAVASVFVIYFQVKPERKLLTSFLVAYLLILVLSNLALVMINMGWMAQTPHFYKVMMPFSLLVPLTNYWYVKGSLGQDLKYRAIDLIQLLPFVLAIIHYVPFYLMPLEQKGPVVQAVIQNSEVLVSYQYGWIFQEIQIYVIRTVQEIIYAFLSFKALFRFRKEYPKQLLDRRSKAIHKWITFFVYTLAAYLLGKILSSIVLSLNYNGIQLNEIVEQTLFLLTALFVFGLSSYLLLNPRSLLALDKSIANLSEKEYPTNIDDIISKIIEQNWHINHELTQPQLISELNIKPTEFSMALKAAGFVNYNDFLNSIRLKCFLELATPKELERNSIEGIASACGFKSPATFYRIFKAKFKTTPKRYLSDRQFDNEK